jgi:type IV secretion system protein VirB9
MNSRRLRLIALGAIALSLQAQAMTVPVSAEEDSHLQSVPFTNDIIAVQSQIGLMTVIRFGDGEVVQNYGMGDGGAWKVTFSGNEIDFVPKDEQADTNLYVITNRHKYWFNVALKANSFPLHNADDVDASRKDRKGHKIAPPPVKYLPPTWQLNVTYPASEVAAVAAANPAVKAEKAKAEIKSDFEKAATEGRLDADYGYIGDDDLLPTAAYNNGQQTYIVFPPDTALPTVYEKLPNGQEVRVGRHMEGDMMVVHTVARKLIIRRGELAGCLIDGHFHPSGPNLNTETISPDVRRVLNTPGGDSQ